MPETFSPDFYERLGVDPDSDARLIRRHYRLLARLYHPDLNANAQAHSRFLKLREAYEVLSDAQQRSVYDLWLQREQRYWQPLVINQQLFPTTLVRGVPQQRAYLLLDLSVKSESFGNNTPLNVVLVLDRSSSMKGLRLHYVKEAARQIIANLTSYDYFGLVTFNDRATLVLPTGPATDTSVAFSAIDSITPAGGTEMATGLHLGLQEIARHHSPSLISHLIVLTDGRTYGDEESCLEMSELAGKQAIGLTVMGLGTDWNDEFLDELARRGTGSAHFIAEPDQAVELFQSQIRQLQRTSARDAVLTIQPSPGVKVLQAHEVAPGLRRLHVEPNCLRLGTLPASPPLRVLLEFSIEEPEQEVVLLGEFTLEAHLVQSATSHRMKRLALVEVGDKASEPPEEIYRSAQRVAIARLQERALEAIEQGQGTRAIHSLEQLADRFLEIGAMELAIATQREAEVLQQTGHLSHGGRKIIKYGTRLLALPAPSEDGP